MIEKRDQARTNLRRYKGLWQAAAETAIAVEAASQQPADLAVPASPPPQGLAPEPSREGASPSLQKDLGRRLIQTQKISRLQLLSLWTPIGLFTWTAWAHARVFALACYCQVEIPTETLRSLRRPLGWLWYRKSSLALCRMLTFVEPQAQKSFWLRSLRCFPPLFVWGFERQLRRMFPDASAATPSQKAGLDA